MRRPGLFVVACAVALGIATANPGAAGEALKIDEITSKKVSLFGAPTGKKIRRVPKSEIKTPLDVLDVSQNGRLLVVIDGEKVWVNSHQVRTNQTVNFESGCVKTQDYAAVRGMGNCK